MDRLVRHPVSDQTAKAPENDQTAESLEVGTPLLSRTVSPKLCEDGDCLWEKWNWTSVPVGGRDGTLRRRSFGFCRRVTRTTTLTEALGYGGKFTLVHL
ncbi:hypothetical protein ACFX1X_027672 [Malus domestica]